MELVTRQLKVIKGEAYIAIYENGVVVDSMITHIPEGNEAVLALKAGSELIAKGTEQEVLDEIERLKLIYNPVQ